MHLEASEALEAGMLANGRSGLERFEAASLMSLNTCAKSDGKGHSLGRSHHSGSNVVIDVKIS